MPCMYYSGEESEDITFGDPDKYCIGINPGLYARVQLDKERNARVFLGTHLLRIHNYTPDSELSRERIDWLVAKSDASVSLETKVFIPALIYVSNTITTAEFREMTSYEFKTTYLAPLGDALRESSIRRKYLLDQYDYPFGDATHVEGDIHLYFDENIAGTINILYRDICDIYHSFGKPTIIKPPFG